MKTSRDPRHLKRIKIMQDLYSWDLAKNSFEDKTQIQPVIDHVQQIDQDILKAAVSWPLQQINKVDLAILRLAVFELIIKKDQPFKVVVDEAIELAKKYGSEASPGFINGVLGKVIENNQENAKRKEQR